MAIKSNNRDKCAPLPSSPTEFFNDAECPDCTDAPGSCNCVLDDILFTNDATVCETSLGISRGMDARQIQQIVTAKLCDIESPTCEDVEVSETYPNIGYDGYGQLCDVLSDVDDAIGVLQAGINNVLYNNNAIANTQTTGGFEALKTYTMPAGTLKTDGSKLNVTAIFLTNNTANNSSLKNININFGSFFTIAGVMPSFQGQTSWTVVNLSISRTNNTTVIVQATIEYYTTSFVVTLNLKSLTANTNISGLDLTANSYNISAVAKSIVIGDITNSSFQIDILRK